MDYSKYSGSSILGFCHSMLCILHQIHIFYNSRPVSLSRGLHASNCIIKIKLSKYILIKSGCHWPACLWFLSFSQYLDYSMRKLMFFTKRGGRLHPTGFSTSPQQKKKLKTLKIPKKISFFKIFLLIYYY